MTHPDTLEKKPKPIAKESTKVRRARKLIESMLDEESSRITPEALMIERKKIYRRLNDSKAQSKKTKRSTRAKAKKAS